MVPPHVKKEFEDVLVQLSGAIKQALENDICLAEDAKVFHLLSKAKGKVAWMSYLGGPGPDPEAIYRCEIDDAAQAYLSMLDEHGLSGNDALDFVCEEYEFDFGDGGYAPAPYFVDKQSALKFSPNIEAGKQDYKDCYDDSSEDEEYEEDIKEDDDKYGCKDEARTKNRDAEEIKNNKIAYWIIRLDICDRLKELRPGVFK